MVWVMTFGFMAMMGIWALLHIQSSVEGWRYLQLRLTWHISLL